MRIAFFLNSSLIILASVAASLGQELESVKLDEVRLSQTPHAKFALHPDGNLIAVFGVDNSVGLVDRQSQKIIRKLVGHSMMVRAAQLSKDGGALASGGVDKQVLLWSIPDGELTMKLDHHRGEVSSLTDERYSTLTKRVAKPRETGRSNQNVAHCGLLRGWLRRTS